MFKPAPVGIEAFARVRRKQCAEAGETTLDAPPPPARRSITRDSWRKTLGRIEMNSRALLLWPRLVTFDSPRMRVERSGNVGFHASALRGTPSDPAPASRTRKRAPAKVPTPARVRKCELSCKRVS